MELGQHPEAPFRVVEDPRVLCLGVAQGAAGALPFGVALVALYLPDQWMLPTLLLGLASTLGVWGYAVVQAWRAARRLPVA